MYMSSCSDSTVEESPCGTNGVFASATNECFCGVFYEGEFCEIEIREKFIGVWTAFNHSCSEADSLQDGIIVNMLRTNDVSQVRIESQGIFHKDILISTVADVTQLRFEDIVTVGSSVMTEYIIDITFEPSTEELLISIMDDQDLDGSIDNCIFRLRKS